MSWSNLHFTIYTKFSQTCVYLNFSSTANRKWYASLKLTVLEKVKSSLDLTWPWKQRKVKWLNNCFMRKLTSRFVVKQNLFQTNVLQVRNSYGLQSEYKQFLFTTIIPDANYISFMVVKSLFSYIIHAIKAIAVTFFICCKMHINYIKLISKQVVALKEAL